MEAGTKSSAAYPGGARATGKALRDSPWFAPGAIAGWLIALLWIAFVTQIFLSIRYVYRQGWFFSIFKFLFGGFVYLMVLLAALAITFFATLVLPS